jgi:hypothetical protein
MLVAKRGVVHKSINSRQGDEAASRLRDDALRSTAAMCFSEDGGDPARPTTDFHRLRTTHDSAVIGGGDALGNKWQRPPLYKRCLSRNALVATRAPALVPLDRWGRFFIQIQLEPSLLCPGSLFL